MSLLSLSLSVKVNRNLQSGKMSMILENVICLCAFVFSSLHELVKTGVGWGSLHCISEVLLHLQDKISSIFT